MSIRTVGSSVCLALFIYGVLTVQGTCPKPKPPTNGNFNSSSQNDHVPLGTIVRFYCYNGYQLKGSIKIECQEHGQWSAKPPTCVSDTGGECQPALSISNGLITVSNDYPKIGSTVTYSCDSGYKLEGTASLVCLPTRQWSHGTPSCIRVKCPIPDKPDNCEVEYDDLSYGSIVRYYCVDSCRQLVGPRIRNCQADGTWSGDTPFCRKMGCPTLHQVITNGHIKYYKNGESITGFTCAMFGVKAIFYCDKLFVLSEGSSVRTCLRGVGVWSGSKNPVCKALACEYPPAVSNGKWTRKCFPSKLFTVGQCLNYECSSSYYLWGTPTRACYVTDTNKPYWNSAPPKCLTLTQFSKQCENQGEVLLWDKETRTPSCVPRHSTESSTKSSEVGTLTIVTATAGSIFGVLVVLVFVVACQRRRNYYYLRRSTRRRGTDDHCTLIAYSGDVHFVLPSYDEAITQEEREPPSFEAAVGNLRTLEEENEGTDNQEEQSQAVNEDSVVTTTNLDMGNNNTEDSDAATYSYCSATPNPIYEEIENNSRENAAELSDSEPEAVLDPSGLADMSMWTLLA